MATTNNDAFASKGAAMIHRTNGKPHLMSDLPAWALTTAEPEDYAALACGRRPDPDMVRWPDLSKLKVWARQQRWPVPLFGFKRAFLDRMMESEDNFRRAVRHSGIAWTIPKSEHRLSAWELRDLDELYQEPAADQRAGSWHALVVGLREIRRAIEAGVAIAIEDGPTLRSWQAFYSWAHSRYPRLEEGCDHWIGDDAS
jgi:hypothetical protein